MRYITALFFFFAAGSSCYKAHTIDLQIQNNPPNNPATTPIMKQYSYLALGDSYTIGESVPFTENFPSQATRKMNGDTVAFLPRIIARTGWTTDELESGMVAANAAEQMQSSYDFVSLLIGVNNQYRGRPVENYKAEFEELLLKAISLAGNRPERVVVLSIPDWGVTPFATGRDRAQIATEIDAYNAANKQVSIQYNIHYIDITPWTREAATDLSLLTTDGLHPSVKEYSRWAEKLAIFFRTKI